MSGINPTGRDIWLRTSTVWVRIPYARPIKTVQQSILLLHQEHELGVRFLRPQPIYIADW